MVPGPDRRAHALRAPQPVYRDHRLGKAVRRCAQRGHQVPYLHQRGDTLDYVYELVDDTLTIWGRNRGSDALYTGTLSADGNTMTGAWSWPGGGYTTLSTRQPATGSTATQKG